MRLPLAALLGTALTSSAVGCSLLISFDEVPDAAPQLSVVEAGRRDARIAVEDAEIPDEPDAAPVTPVFPPECDPNIDLDAIDCTNFQRPNCAKRSGFDGYPGENRANDLVECNGGPHPTCVRHCPNGCAQIDVAGVPDQCDDCKGRGDGTYCGKDFTRWDPKANDVAIRCVDGQASSSANCGARLCATTCPPGGVSTERPACCTATPQ